jgi:dynein heavy chain
LTLGECTCRGRAIFQHHALFTANTEAALIEGTPAALQAALAKETSRIQALADVNSKTDAAFRAEGRPPNYRKSNETLILLSVHKRETLESLVAKRVSSIDAVDWTFKARAYVRDGTASIMLGDTELPYRGEYLGTKERLVVTPLTDRCQALLAQSIRLRLGTRIEGPAGTGKTETTKDFGCMVGQWVICSNCGDQMDYIVLGTMLRGAISAGAWICFDEFNRIDLAVLAAVGGQFGEILAAVRAATTSFDFMGSTLNLDMTKMRAAHFVCTLNPGYGGRQELPTSVKAQLRPMTMMVADRHDRHPNKGPCPVPVRSL